MESDEEKKAQVERIIDMHNDTEDHVKRQIMRGRIPYSYVDALNEMSKKKLYEDVREGDFGLLFRSYMHMKQSRVIGKFLTFEQALIAMQKYEKKK